jgi:N-acyl-D-amino-acid deacylase
MKNWIAWFRWPLFAALALTLVSCGVNPEDADYDVIIRGGTVYDGLGGDPVITDVGFSGDRIAVIGHLGGASGAIEIDAEGLAVAPGFINMLSWATESLIEDGRSLSDIKQGVTLEVMGEGDSMGPLSEAMRAEAIERQGSIKYDIEWTTLGDYLEYLEAKGISPHFKPGLG